MDFSKGERVRYLGRPDWGPGFVLQDSTNGKVWIHFDGAGPKLLLVRYAKLIKVRATPTRELRQAKRLRQPNERL